MAQAWTEDKLQAFVTEIAKKTISDQLPPELLDPNKIAQMLREADVEDKTVDTVSTAVKAALYAKSELDRVKPSRGARETQRKLMTLGVLAHKAGFRSGEDAVREYKTLCASQSRSEDDTIVKALQATTFAAGGALIPEELSSEFIEFLRPATVVRRMGARTVNVSGGRLDIGRQNAGAQTYWIGEGVAITPSQPEFGRLILNTKKIATIVPVSNDLVEQVPLGMEGIVGDDMLASHAVSEDQAFIRSLGTANRPTGIRYLVNQTTNVQATAGTTLDQVTTDLTKAQYRVMDADVRGTTPGWMMHPRSFMHLLTLRNTNGFYVFMDMLARGELYGAPVGITTSIPRNLGGGTETELYYGYFDQLIIGETNPVRLEQSDSAGYVQGGTQNNAFPQDEKLFRLIHKVDSVLRHNRAFTVITGITWGASLDS